MSASKIGNVLTFTPLTKKEKRQVDDLLKDPAFVAAIKDIVAEAARQDVAMDDESLDDLYLIPNLIMDDYFKQLVDDLD